MLFPDSAIPADLISDYLITADGSALLRPVKTFEHNDKESIDNRINDYEKFIQRHPGIELFIFNVNLVEMTPYHPNSGLTATADNGQSLNYFLRNKPTGLNFENLEINDFNDHLEKFFPSDHHWNIHGALEEYYKIYKMLSDAYSNLGPPAEIMSIKKLEGVDFLGAYARGSLYPIKPDAFEAAIYELPEFKIFYENQEIALGKKAEYFNGDFSSDKYTNHYREFYGRGTRSLLYQFRNNERNLLIIASSHALCIQDLRASHFNKTLVVDYRSSLLKEYSIDQIMEDYKMDAVLILAQPNITYMSDEFKFYP